MDEFVNPLQWLKQILAACHHFANICASCRVISSTSKVICHSVTSRTYNQIYHLLHPQKLKCPLKRDHFERTFHLQTINFQGIFVSFQGYSQLLLTQGPRFGITALLLHWDVLRHCLSNLGSRGMTFSQPGPVELQADPGDLQFLQIFTVKGSEVFFRFFCATKSTTVNIFTVKVIVHPIVEEILNLGDFHLSHQSLWECTKDWQQDQTVWPLRPFSDGQSSGLFAP